MKCELTFIGLMAVAIMTGCASQSGQANHAHGHGDKKDSLTTAGLSLTEPVKKADSNVGAQTTGPVDVGNKICPVSREKIPEPGEKNAMGEAVKYEYNGKIYNLCCPMCVKDFKKDPEKYSQTAEDMN